MRLTVPGNLLLAGEYAVLEEGGLGLAAAVEPRASAEAHPSDVWTLTARFQGGEEVWQSGHGSVPALLEAVWLETGQPSPPVRVVLDTQAFSVGGRKTGLGSSAAAAVGLTALMIFLQKGRNPGKEEVFLPALRAHRRFQKGRGSGYDVVTSLFGGIGAFRGGVEPSWEQLALEWLPPFALTRGESEVRTTLAVQSYEAFKILQPKRSQEYVIQNNQEITLLLSSKSWLEGRVHFEKLRSLSMELGSLLGQPAQVPTGGGWASFTKALGAGNELCAVFDCLEGLVSHGLCPVIPDSEGLRWET